MRGLPAVSGLRAHRTRRVRVPQTLTTASQQVAKAGRLLALHVRYVDLVRERMISNILFEISTSKA
jgi:hypothetical protein